ncbi:unnamed protein product [Lathyrus oleraceus]|uniref:HIT-type domain-containing protein n=1 Tax=Pisum sativum TaxID=3888 RepID=A0A9D4W564_PEA|nr:uncharacterized protein LOC127095677 [Pisum sativum]XP_050890289.1 uncharacterized protein LOC127095677 [Pisum sativum]KAI5395337.1 hypothetical protein KIW84_061793 [Pisum sativum]
MGPKQCQICHKAQSKYKCPKCYLPYCSLACFKNHKELPCVNPTTSAPKTTALESHVEKPSVVENTVLEAVVEKPLLVDKRGQVLDQFQLEAIASSSEIRDALNNKSLQELVCRIDCSPNAENELDKAMADEAFRVFTDKILSTINP